jgi:hypothetical protein
MNYERGLAQMKQGLQGTMSYQEFLLFEFRLQENLQNERYYGTNEQIRSDCARIIEQLNRLALEHLQASFNDLCIEKFSQLNSALKDKNQAVALNKPTASSRKGVFISCSHKDRGYAEELHTHLAHASHRGAVHIWDYTKILPGTRWQEEIDNALRSSDIAILLISADFLASDFIINYELPYILAAVEHEQLTIFCVILRPCTFASSELAAFQTVNVPDHPLSAMSQAGREAIWVEVVNLIEQAS